MSAATLTAVHRQFEAALPAIHRHARYSLRHRRRDRDDLLAEVAACAWKAWYGLTRRGRDPLAVGISGIAAWAARHALKGRRIGNRGGGRGAMDIFHPRAQRIRQFRVVSGDSAPVAGTGTGPGTWLEWLAIDNRVSPADEAAFRLDFAAWLAVLPDRMRMAAELLAAGHGTGETAALCRITPARVSQLRRQLCRSWSAFQGEPAPTT